MEKKFLVVLAFCCVAVAVQAQLLWKVSGNGLKEPSYLFGTYHLAPSSVLDGKPSIEELLGSVGQVYGEVDFSELQNGGMMQQMAAAMMLPDNMQLPDLLTERQAEKLDSMMSARLGVTLYNPAVSRMKPVAILSQLDIAICAGLTKGFDPGQPLDLYFQQKAVEAGKPCKGLETVMQQLDVLYGAALPRQVEQLMCLVEEEAWNVAMAKRMVDAYMRQDLDALDEIIAEKNNSGCDATPEEEERLIFGRNDAWMQVIPDAMREKPTLFVVGAGHLTGNRGLLAQLRAQGFTVEGIRIEK